jgi:cystathionine beta-lyase/cystathionine gamma-synthase
MSRGHGPSTRAIHAGASVSEDVAPPLRRSVIGTFDTAARFGDVMEGVEEGYLYGRLGNPTVLETARAIAALEGAEAAALTASGMAAVHAAVVALVPNGGRIVLALQSYGNSISLLRDLIAPRFGVALAIVDITDLAAVRAACVGGVDAVYCETIANPGGVVADLDALAAIAHGAGGRLIVDSTIATPLLCRPIEHGADVVVHSATKFLNGHHDVLAGVVCGSAVDVARVRAVLVDTGGVCDPDSAWLLRRGMRTLALRLERQCANALALARWLDGRPEIISVPYAGLASHPQHALATRLLAGAYGAVLPVEVRGGRTGGEALMDAVTLIERVTSIGGVSSGISHPASTSHRQLSEKALEQAGIPAGLLRIAVGCEDAPDLIADMEQALAVATASGALGGARS